MRAWMKSTLRQSSACSSPMRRPVIAAATIIDKTKSRENIDAVVALAMVVESAEAPTPTVQLLGWL